MLKERRILICQGTGCLSSKSGELKRNFEEQIENLNLQDRVKITFTGCHGFCAQGPIVVIEPDKTLYCKVKPSQVKTILESHIMFDVPVEKYFYIDPKTNRSIEKFTEINFYKKQNRLILANCGHINPENIEEYLAPDVGGYNALKKALKMSPEEIIDNIKQSGLRGRGGAGFPTGLKWEFCKKSPGEEKYVICNADEGDPGAFIDGYILEADPHSVLEGMIIGGYAIGASHGIIYVRAEYPLAIKRFRKALLDAEVHGFLGSNILGSNLSFSVSIHEGAGAFVCGEETAMISSIEGYRGNPRPKPPFPATDGLWGKPTNINNVKTWSAVTWIIRNGWEKFHKIGVEHAPGTAIFSLSGKIKNSGMIEVPMGTTLREIIFDIGGGILNDKKFKAVQTGGPSGGCLPSSHLDSPVDYETMSALGSIMGSGGMIVLDEDDCMVNIAHYFITFTQNESCGKCVPCRIGTRAMLVLLEKIVNGKGVERDLMSLEEIAYTVKMGSLCGLGQTAPNPVLTTLKYFRDEYVAHIRDKKCPAKACKAFINYYIEPDLCIGCTICSINCPVDAITGKKGQLHIINYDQCVKCGVCYASCNSNAIVKKHRGTI